MKTSQQENQCKTKQKQWMPQTGNVHFYCAQENQCYTKQKHWGPQTGNVHVFYAQEHNVIPNINNEDSNRTCTCLLCTGKLMLYQTKQWRLQKGNVHVHRKTIVITNINNEDLKQEMTTFIVHRKTNVIPNINNEDLKQEMYMCTGKPMLYQT